MPGASDKPSRTIGCKPIGYVHCATRDVPRHWTVSDLEGELEIRPAYEKGLLDIAAGQRILVLFHFDRSVPFTPHHLQQKKRHKNEVKGVFSICSSIRPNPIGVSVLEVLAVEGRFIRVRGLDMFDGTPILDIKPHTEDHASRGRRPNLEDMAR
ncbi:MAG: tRNA (N6-threonylcarbamoyladenosine(37)-N6)-methyltransferase TrmO [Desulfobacterales bacterium]|jgi:tRNA-Thr(GGU) m(6)t(6)A37 methyltransferase TsaA